MFPGSTHTIKHVGRPKNLEHSNPHHLSSWETANAATNRAQRAIQITINIRSTMPIADSLVVPTALLPRMVLMTDDPRHLVCLGWLYSARRVGPTRPWPPEHHSTPWLGLLGALLTRVLTWPRVQLPSWLGCCDNASISTSVRAVNLCTLQQENKCMLPFSFCSTS